MPNLPKLCDGCPLAGIAKCELVGEARTPDTAVMLTKNWGFAIGELGVLVDREGNASEVLNFSQAAADATTFDALAPRIEQCQAPVERRGRWDRLLRRPPVCPALGNLAIDKSYPLDVAVAEAVQPMLATRAKFLGAFARQLLQIRPR